MDPAKKPERFEVSHDAVDLVDEIELLIDLSIGFHANTTDNREALNEKLELCRRRLRDMFRARDPRPGIITDKP